MTQFDPNTDEIARLTSLVERAEQAGYREGSPEDRASLRFLLDRLATAIARPLNRRQEQADDAIMRTWLRQRQPPEDPRA